MELIILFRNKKSKYYCGPCLLDQVTKKKREIQREREGSRSPSSIVELIRLLEQHQWRVNHLAAAVNAPWRKKMKNSAKNHRNFSSPFTHSQTLIRFISIEKFPFIDRIDFLTQVIRY